MMDSPFRCVPEVVPARAPVPDGKVPMRQLPAHAGADVLAVMRASIQNASVTMKAPIELGFLRWSHVEPPFL